MKTQSQLCLNLSRITSYTGTLRHARNTGRESVDLILVDFLQKDSLTEHKKAETMLVSILNKVKAYIDSELNPVKPKFCDKSRDDFEHVGSINCILNQLGISEEDYYNA